MNTTENSVSRNDINCPSQQTTTVQTIVLLDNIFTSRKQLTVLTFSCETSTNVKSWSWPTVVGHKNS
jgi:hypothetical protein